MKKLIIATLAVGMLLAPAAQAAPEQGEYDQFGIVVTGLDHRFPDAVTVMVNDATNINRPGPDGVDVPHVHFWPDTMPAGGRDSLVGRAFVADVYGIEDGRGKHWYVTKLAETSAAKALDQAGVQEDSEVRLSYEDRKNLEGK